MSLLLDGLPPCTDARLDHETIHVVAWRYDDPEGFADFFHRHGEDADTVESVEFVRADAGPSLRFSVYLERNGFRYLECASTDVHPPHDGACRVAMATVTHRLVGELPAWWQPEGRRP